MPLQINIKELLHGQIVEWEWIEFKKESIPPVTNESLKQDRIIAKEYRKRRIGDFLKELDLTEGRGTGIPKIRHALKKNYSLKPIFETD